MTFPLEMIQQSSIYSGFKEEDRTPSVEERESELVIKKGKGKEKTTKSRQFCNEPEMIN